MSDIQFEIKGEDLRSGMGSSARGPFWDNHVADNVAVTATATWADVTGMETLPEGVLSVIVSNLGADAVGVAFSYEADPARFHVIAANTQREVYPLSGSAAKPCKVKTL